MKLPSDRKLQIFVSSTYLDLRTERQAAVQAILETGHIPAGMELFAAGNEEQMQVIRRWIDQSDIFLLILGRRYGSIEPSTGKSYIHLEYDYARALEKPFFALVLSDGFINSKIRTGESVDAVTERAAPDKFNAFRDQVTSKLCKFVEDPKDIRFAIAQSIGELEKRHQLVGWVSRREGFETSGSRDTESAHGVDGQRAFLHSAVFGALDAPFPESAAMRDVRHRASRLAQSDLAILIDGEPGTGRRTLAAGLARMRADKTRGQVLTLDGIEGITDDFRSALRSAPTVAKDVLFHHIEALPEKQQAELAKMIHSKQIRLVAVTRATSSEDDESVPRELAIRSPDLSAELQATHLLLPPLRERGEDVARWAEYLLTRATERFDAPLRTLSRGAMNGLLRHRWPGNLIELDAVINRALCMTSKPEIEASDLGISEDAPAISPLKDAVDEFQSGYIDRALAHFSGNRTQTARALGVDVRTVFRHLERRGR